MVRESKKEKKIREEVIKELKSELPSISVYPLSSEIKGAILSTGLAVFGAGKSGKSNTVQVIASELMKDDHIQVKIVDKVQNWVHEFERIKYQDVYEDRVDNTELYLGNDNFLYNCKFRSGDAIKKLVSNMVDIDYEIQWRKKEVGMMDDWIVWIIEEAQNVLNTIGKKDRWNVYISEGRNLNMAFIFIARRMAQLSSKARENMRGYMFGRMSGVNNLNMIRRLSNSTIKELVPELPERGTREFVYWDGDSGCLVIDTPLYSDIKGEGHPVRWRG